MIRSWFDWCTLCGLEPLSVRRAHVELWQLTATTDTPADAAIVDIDYRFYGNPRGGFYWMLDG